MSKDRIKELCKILIERYVRVFEEKEDIKEIEKEIKNLCKGIGLKDRETKLLISFCKERAKGIAENAGDKAQEKLFEIQELSTVAKNLYELLPPLERLK